ncbi:Na(+)-translocating NADH-quinone reductase subunit A [Ruegeria pomeroyi]|nr:Na(+)-translocating NADH-quinone reductase subunit A [Ruegeria pomeroyi]MCE8534622.1 Na(+)-translocating NADH-quinone reductase subunit A [Ruegeria pomeroyi]
MRRVETKKGLNIPIAGAPSSQIDTAQTTRFVALLGGDYVGLEPKMLVREGEEVAVGQPLFQQKRDPAIKFVAPAGGTVVQINRGERRVLKSVVIEVASDAATHELRQPENLVDSSEEGLRARLLESGLWTAFRTRPFSRIPKSDAKPRSIFVTASETRPLAGAPEVVVAGYEEDFSIGLDVLARLAEGKVYLCSGGAWSGPTGNSNLVEHVVFEGPHPAGLPGTHIHHLDPVGAGAEVWHIGYQDVIALGKLVTEGSYWTERVVALGGSGFSNPRMVRTRLGADIIALTAGELAEAGADYTRTRLISGCVLNGRNARGAEAYLGRYHMQVSAVPELKPSRWRPWQKMIGDQFEFASLISRLRFQNSDAHFTTDQLGRPTAMVPVDAFEQVIPMDILAVPLLKSLLIQDTDQAQALGCMELDEEDLALCAFICPGKKDYASVLRRNLDVIERDG